MCPAAAVGIGLEVGGYRGPDVGLKLADLELAAVDTQDEALTRR